MDIVLCDVPESMIAAANPEDRCECEGPPIYGDGQRFYCEDCVPPSLRRAIASWLRGLVAATPDLGSFQTHAGSN